MMNVADLDLLEKVEVVYETFPGWKLDISACRKYSDLPEKARKYVERIEVLLGVRGRLSTSSIADCKPTLALNSRFDIV